jgi:hypothetical protein
LLTLEFFLVKDNALAVYQVWVKSHFVDLSI